MLTLRNRLVLVNVLVFLLTFVVLIGVLSGQLLSHLYEQFDQELVRAANRALTHVVMVDGSPRMIETDDRPTADLGPAGFVRLLDSQGTITDGAGAVPKPRRGARSLVGTRKGDDFRTARARPACSCGSTPDPSMRRLARTTASR